MPSFPSQSALLLPISEMFAVLSFAMTRAIRTASLTLISPSQSASPGLRTGVCESEVLTVVVTVVVVLEIEVIVVVVVVVLENEVNVPEVAVVSEVVVVVAVVPVVT